MMLVSQEDHVLVTTNNNQNTQNQDKQDESKQSTQTFFKKNKITLKITSIFMIAICLPILIIFIKSNSYYDSATNILTNINKQLGFLNKNYSTNTFKSMFEGILIQFNEITTQFDHNISEVTSENYLLIFLALILGILISVLFGLRLQKYYSILKNSFQEVIQGNYSYRIPNKKENDFGTLTSLFNTMLDKLNKTNQEELENLNQKENYLNEEYDLKLRNFYQKQREVAQLLHQHIKYPRIDGIKVSANQSVTGRGGHFFIVPVSNKKIVFFLLEILKDDVIALFLINFFMTYTKQEFQEKQTDEDYFNKVKEKIESFSNKFKISITAFYGIINLKTMKLLFYNQGFKNPVYFGNYGSEIQLIKSNGKNDQLSEVEELQFRVGDKLLLCNRDLSLVVQGGKYKLKLSSNIELIGEATLQDLLSKLSYYINEGMVKETMIFFEFDDIAKKNPSKNQTSKNDTDDEIEQMIDEEKLEVVVDEKQM